MAFTIAVGTSPASVIDLDSSVWIAVLDLGAEFAPTPISSSMHASGH